MTSVILRILGILFILPSLFFQTFLDWFPGLPDQANWGFLIVGVVCYLAGAVISNLEKRKRDQSSELKEDL